MYNYDRTKTAGKDWSQIQRDTQEKFLMDVLDAARRVVRGFAPGKPQNGVVFSEYNGKEVLLMFDPKNIHHLRMSYGRDSKVEYATDAGSMGKSLVKWMDYSGWLHDLVVSK